MTLNEWLKTWPYLGRNFVDGKLSETFGPSDGDSVYVVADAVNENRPDAFHLSDYVVSSVSGGSIWFVRRTS